MAHHFDRAEATAKAVRYGRAAGDLAKRLYAHAEALAHYEMVVRNLDLLAGAAADAADSDGVARQRFDVLGERQGIWMLLGQFERAREDLGEMVAMARTTRDPGRLSNALNGMGNLYVNMGRPVDARPLLEEALMIKRDLGDLPGQADSLNMVALAALSLGDVAVGWAQLEESNQLRRTIGDRPGLARSEWTMGAVAYEALGDYERALGHLEQALALSQETQNRALGSGSTLMIGAVHTRLGDYAQALPRMEQVLQQARELGDRTTEGWALLYLSWVQRETRQFDEARTHANAALRIAEEVPEDLLHWYALHALARIALDEQQPEAALDLARRAEQVSRQKTGWAQTLIWSLATQARALALCGQAADAGRCAHQALAALAAMHYQGVPELPGVYWSCAVALHAAGDPLAEAIFGSAEQALAAQSALITSPERRGTFLQGVAIHRAILPDASRTA